MSASRARLGNGNCAGYQWFRVRRGYWRGNEFGRCADLWKSVCCWSCCASIAESDYCERQRLGELERSLRSYEISGLLE